MLRSRLLPFALAGALFATGCTTTYIVPSGGDGEVASAGAASAQDLYCDALETALLLDDDATPEATPEEAAAIYQAAADAATVPEQGELLAGIADIYRNPDDADGGDAFGLIAQAGPTYKFAQDVCGIETPGIVVADDGTLTFQATSTTGDASATLSFGDGESAEPTTDLIPSGPGSEPEIGTAGTPDERLAALNASVPEGVDLAFAWSDLATDDDDDALQVATPAPINWPAEIGGLSGVELAGPDSFDGARMEVKSLCQGFCQAKDWTETMDDPEVSPFAVSATEEFTLLLNQELSNPPGRIMVREFPEDSFFNGKLEIILTRWHPQADHFFRCRVNLPEAVSDLWRQFSEACALADPAWMP